MTELERIENESNKDRFKLTESGLKWLKIDLANTYGNDKLIHEEQIKWFNSNINDILDHPKNWIETAESPFEFSQVIENYKMYENNEPINGLMYVDCSNQALQCYAVLTGDLKTAEVCNLSGKDIRVDGYQILANKLNEHFSIPFISRSNAKKPMMVTLYGKQRAWESMLDLLSANLDNTDVYSDEFTSTMDEIFKNSMHEIAPNAMNAMAKLQMLNDENIGTYNWTLPDGFKVQYDVKTETKINAERITKSGKHISIEDTVVEYKANKYNAGMAPNVVHSVDAYICRELIRRFDGFITTIHDAYAVHYNFIDDLIKIWKDIMIEILDSNMLNDIMIEIANGRRFKPIVKSKTLTRYHIRKSEYAVS